MGVVRENSILIGDGIDVESMHLQPFAAVLLHVLDDHDHRSVGARHVLEDEEPTMFQVVHVSQVSDEAIDGLVGHNRSMVVEDVNLPVFVRMRPDVAAQLKVVAHPLPINIVRWMEPVVGRMEVAGLIEPVLDVVGQGNPGSLVDILEPLDIR